ncbi:MAG: hypothetical protein JWN23_3375 [Rhodocyclales bacterium]|nr:hypothetical protein [Rhodocyclales bacterium]
MEEQYMTTRLLKVMSLCLVAILTGCAAGPKLLIDKNTSPLPYCSSVTTGYSATYFDTRFFGAAWLTGFLGGPIASAVRYGITVGETKTADRLHENDYENLLKEFDTTTYFFQQLEQRADESRYVKFEFTKDAELITAIPLHLKTSIETPDALSKPPALGSNACMAVFKLVYGIGLKAGVDGLGFRKTYRPYVRIVGAVKHMPSNKLIWQDNLLAFSSKSYVGGNADAENIPSEELLASMKEVTKDAISVLMKSLNGEVIEDRAVLIDSRRTDFQF